MDPRDRRKMQERQLRVFDKGKSSSWARDHGNRRLSQGCSQRFGYPDDPIH
jgi:hypothetical protein